jgi:hypothetical protein
MNVAAERTMSVQRGLLVAGEGDVKDKSGLQSSE